jgi:hypothetical protein
VVLGVPEPAQRVLVAVVFVVAFEVGGGGVEEQQVDFQVEQVGHGEKHRLLHPPGRVGVDQQIHRPVRLILVHAGQSRDGRVLADPVGGRQLAHRRHRPVGDQREQHPLHVGGEPPPVGGRADRRAHVQPVPQPVQQPGGPDRAGVEDLQRCSADGRPRLGRVRQRPAVAEVLGD